MLILFLFVVACCNPAYFCLADTSPEVTITNGVIRGRTFVSTWTNQTIYAFQGIPYATPPTGSLRFKDPVPPQNWTEPMNCTEDGASCLQPTSVFETTADATLSEDCLFLNVYTQDLNPVDALPVMVVIHGGGYFAGSGNITEFGPDMLVNQSIIVVTLNYRLGAFGFLTLGTTDAPGNSGIKDQLLALKWVQNEISKFGGDPTKVTIFGESAGSSSVHLHYLSPLSKGLFRGVIGDSGSSLSPWAVRSMEDSIFYGLQLASLLNCSSSSNVSIAYACLMAADASSINSLQLYGNLSTKDQENGLSIKFLPTVDKTTSNQSLIPALPSALFELEQGSFVPIIMGINKDEGIIGISGLGTAMANISYYESCYIPLEVKKRCSSSELEALEFKINQFYFNDTLPSITNIRGFLDMNTDTSIAYPTVKTARMYQKREKVYLFYFTFDGSFKQSIAELVELEYNISLVSHAEELNYIFVNQNVDQNATDTKEMKTWERMVKMLTNFVIYGAPTVGEDDILQNVVWQSANNSGTQYMWVDDDLTMVESDILADRMALWDSVTASSSNFNEPFFFAVVSCIFVLIFKSNFVEL